LPGGILETLVPRTVKADSSAPNAASQMNDGAFGWNLNADPVSTQAPNLVVNPNILMIMVDQLRLPQFWLTSGQQSIVDTQIAPNIAAIRMNSYQFTNFFVAAQDCTPSRATLLTGLYAPQTGMFGTQDGNNPPPNLNEGFPTFGNALHDIALYKPKNILWFGKWGVSNYTNDGSGITDEMPNFGFNYGRNGQILYPSTYGSPVGSANQGNNKNYEAKHNLLGVRGDRLRHPISAKGAELRVPGGGMRRLYRVPGGHEQ
jgi:arylsulfatase A-like enzyme